MFEAEVPVFFTWLTWTGSTQPATTPVKSTTAPSSIITVRVPAPPTNRKRLTAASATVSDGVTLAACRHGPEGDYRKA